MRNTEQNIDWSKVQLVTSGFVVVQTTGEHLVDIFTGSVVKLLDKLDGNTVGFKSDSWIKSKFKPYNQSIEELGVRGSTPFCLAGKPAVEESMVRISVIKNGVNLTARLTIQEAESLGILNSENFYKYVNK